MKLNQFIANLLTLVESAPEMAELEVLYCIDEEGNGLHVVTDSPTLINAVIYTDNQAAVSGYPNKSPNAIIIN